MVSSLPIESLSQVTSTFIEIASAVASARLIEFMKSLGINWRIYENMLLPTSTYLYFICISFCRSYEINYRLLPLSSDPTLISFYLHFLLCSKLDFRYYVGLIFDGYRKYENTRDYELNVITDLPYIERWQVDKVHERGTTLELKVQ